MRFASILLLATAVSAVRIQQRATVKVQDPTPEEILEEIKKDPKAALKFIVDKTFEVCDANDDGTLTVDEALECAKKAEKEIPDEVKDKMPKDLDDEDKKFLEKIGEDGKITKKELAEMYKKAWKKYGPSLE